MGYNYSAAKSSHAAKLWHRCRVGEAVANISNSILWVSKGYKVRSQRNPVEPESRGGVPGMPLLLRERRRCLACCGKLSGRQGCGGALGVSLAAPLKTGGRGGGGKSTIKEFYYKLTMQQF